jgi:cellulose synthase (UDP-forming)
MEHLNGRYPWATDDAEAYQRAYRHVVTTGRRYADNVFYVWSPAGNRGLERYWPGREYVDYVGLSLYALRGPDDPTLPPFDRILAEKYGRVEGYARPIVIAELGVSGGQSDQRKWMQAALEAMPKYPLLKSAVYFNAKDTAGAWDSRYGVPDWHIDPDVFRRE